MNIPRVVATGSRNFRDGDRIEADLRALLPLGLRRVAQGGCGVPPHDTSPTNWKPRSSADALALYAAGVLGLWDCETFRVDERLDGKWPACGPRRNRRMLKAERPALVLAYPSRNSVGTWSCIEEAWRLCIPVLVWVHWADDGDATRAVLDALQARGLRVHLTTERLNSGHRVYLGNPDIADALPQELDG